MEDTATQDPQKKHIFLTLIGRFAIYVTGMKLLITLFPEVLHKLSSSHIGVNEFLFLTITFVSNWFLDMLNDLSASDLIIYKLLYLMKTVLFHKIFYNVICGIWLLAAFYLYIQGKYQIFKDSVIRMGICYALFWGLENL
ncbi:hypothetical protein [Paenibacillus amylolyticus]|uniref:hypothetical protein n=1 Tax=Paenibacillus amylolyticus TaxID=1451 RepID=UPI0033953C31